MAHRCIHRGRLVAYFKYNVKFLSLMSSTQLFMEYFEKLKEPVVISESNKQSALFIADWLSFRWKFFNNRKINLCEECCYVDKGCCKGSMDTCEECQRSVAL